MFLAIIAVVVTAVVSFMAGMFMGTKITWEKLGRPDFPEPLKGPQQPSQLMQKTDADKFPIKSLLPPTSVSAPQLRWEYKVNYLTESDGRGVPGDGIASLSLLDMTKGDTGEVLCRKTFNISSFHSVVPGPNWIRYDTTVQKRRSMALTQHRRLRDQIKEWAAERQREWEAKINPPESHLEIF